MEVWRESLIRGKNYAGIKRAIILSKQTRFPRSISSPKLDSTKEMSGSSGNTTNDADIKRSNACEPLT